MRIRIKADSLIRRAELALAVLKSHRDAVAWERQATDRWLKRVFHLMSYQERVENVLMPEVPERWDSDIEVLESMVALPRFAGFEVDLSLAEFAAVETWRKMPFRPPPSNDEVLHYA